MSENKQQLRISIISIWIGVLIPIVAALIPYAYRYIFPEQDLSYELIGPVTVKKTQSISVKIKNKGEKVEKNLEIWLKTNPSYFVLEELFEKKENHKVDPLAHIQIDSANNFSVTKKNDFYIVNLGDIRPNEEISVSVLSDALQVYRYDDREAQGFSIKSEESLGRLERTSDLEGYVYPFGFWMFVILMLLILIAGIHQEYLMDPKKREAWLLKEIDKISKR